ncbi:hypothetical protein CXG81DRAFT_20713 [Caulochytrium protostelioides]|uniref:Nucleolar protein 9 n=1 Tax=Caulochytrium protostelioides TaxID=1555241 RepID=A0A4P9X2S2_9FUNG|nr:hypothetical protein CXG81DRAFT_20713 [Caulochytrium protostelioides]|eukprot:RKO99170.1 hypothetical protein CXG81DRAFT_20713 [Caulochytrium protostelioides]
MPAVVEPATAAAAAAAAAAAHPMSAPAPSPPTPPPAAAAADTDASAGGAAAKSKRRRGRRAKKHGAGAAAAETPETAETAAAAPSDPIAPTSSAPSAVAAAAVPPAAVADPTPAPAIVAAAIVPAAAPAAASADAPAAASANPSAETPAATAATADAPEAAGKKTKKRRRGGKKNKAKAASDGADADAAASEAGDADETTALPPAKRTAFPPPPSRPEPRPAAGGDDEEAFAFPTYHQNSMAVDSDEAAMAYGGAPGAETMPEAPPYLGDVPPDVLHYLLDMEARLDQPDDPALFAQASDYARFVRNMLAELDGHEVALAGDVGGSRVLEKLLARCSDYQLRSVLARFVERWRDTCRHPQASHVVDTLLRLAAGVVDREVRGVSVLLPPVDDDAGDSDDEDAAAAASAGTKATPAFDQLMQSALPTMAELVGQVCAQCAGAWVPMMVDAYSTHPVRVCIALLAGKPPPAKANQRYQSYLKRREKSAAALIEAAGGDPSAVKKGAIHVLGNAPLHALPKHPKTPPAFATLLLGIVNEIADALGDAAVRDLACHAHANPVIQMLLDIPAAAARFAQALQASSETAAGPDAFWQGLITHPSGSHLLEKLITTADDALYARLFRIVVAADDMRALCLHASANFVVQRLCDHLRTEAQGRTLVTAILPFAGHFLFRGRAGVMASVVAAAARWPETMRLLSQRVMDAILQDAPPAAAAAAATDAVPPPAFLLLNLMTAKDWAAGNGRKQFHLHGSLMLQRLLQKSPEDVVQTWLASLLACDAAQLTAAACDRAASRALQVAMPLLATDQRAALVTAVAPSLPTWACDRNASYVLEALMAACNPPLDRHAGDAAYAARAAQRRQCADALAAQLTALVGHPVGRFAARNAKLEHLRRDPEGWERVMDRLAMGEPTAAAGFRAPAPGASPGGRQPKPRPTPSGPPDPRASRGAPAASRPPPRRAVPSTLRR